MIWSQARFQHIYFPNNQEYHKILEEAEENQKQKDFEQYKKEWLND